MSAPENDSTQALRAAINQVQIAASKAYTDGVRDGLTQAASYIRGQSGATHTDPIGTVLMRLADNVNLLGMEQYRNPRGGSDTPPQPPN